MSDFILTITIEWPICLAGYILEKIDENKLLNIRKDNADDIVELLDRNLCKCYFYIYCKNRELDKNVGIKYLNKITKLSASAMLEEEYFLTKARFKNTDNSQRLFLPVVNYTHGGCR